MNPEPTVVIVPGLRDHVADHWQTHLGEHLAATGTPVRAVPPLEVDRLSRGWKGRRRRPGAGRTSRRARVAALDAVLAGIAGPVVLVAHSAGVITTVHWAQTAGRPVFGALLAAPADLETPLPAGYPTTAELDAGGWNPIPRTRLPFPSIMAISTNDPLARHRRVTGLAEVWGSKPVTVGAAGHLNPASGHGPWPLATALVAELAGAALTGAHRRG